VPQSVFLPGPLKRRNWTQYNEFGGDLGAAGDLWVARCDREPADIIEL
jgi:hypothetical protein